MAARRRSHSGRENLSPWWIFAGVFQIGLLFSGIWLGRLKSRHRNAGAVFAVLFIITVFINGVTYGQNNAAIALAWLGIEFFIAISVAMYYQRSDKALSDLSAYVAIGLVIGLAVSVLLNSFWIIL